MADDPLCQGVWAFTPHELAQLNILMREKKMKNEPKKTLNKSVVKV